MATDQFSWLTLALIKPDSFKEASSGLSNACNSGTRHFAANGRTVDLSEVAKVAYEIRRYELEKDDLPQPPSRHLMKRSSYRGDPGDTAASDKKAAKFPEDQVLATIQRGAGTPVLKEAQPENLSLSGQTTRLKIRIAEKVRGERHFEGVNNDWGDHAQFENGRTPAFSEDY